MRTFKCEDCGHTWQLPFGQGGRGVDLTCPQCASRSIYRVEGERGGRGRYRHGFLGRDRGRGRRAEAGTGENTGNADTA
jgi:transposase-like protein